MNIKSKVDNEQGLHLPFGYHTVFHPKYEMICKFYDKGCVIPSAIAGRCTNRYDCQSRKYYKKYGTEQCFSNKSKR